MQRTFIRTITVEYTLTDELPVGPGLNEWADLGETAVADIIRDEKAMRLSAWFGTTEYTLGLDQIIECAQPAVSAS